MKEGNNVLCGEDIVEGTKGRLRGTHVYPIEINRDAEPSAAKTLSGISQCGDFEYTGNGIVMRENTALGEGKLYTKALLNTLAKNNFTTTNASTGFKLNLAKQVPNLLPNVMKAKVSVTPMKKSNKAQNSKNNPLRQCEECSKTFLPTGNLQRHKESKTCTSKRQS